MTPAEAAKIIRISLSQIRQAVRKGLIPAEKKPLLNGNPKAFEYDLRIQDVLFYRDHRPKPGPKARQRPKSQEQELLDRRCDFGIYPLVEPRTIRSRRIRTRHLKISAMNGCVTFSSVAQVPLNLADGSHTS
jgi:hypothetical protein